MLSNEFGPRRSSVGLRFAGIRRDGRSPRRWRSRAPRRPDGELLDGDARSYRI